RLVCRLGESLGCGGRNPVNELRQGGIGNRRNRALAEVVIIQAKNAGVGPKTEFVGPTAPGQVVINEEACRAPALQPRIVKTSDRRERRVRSLTLQNNREGGEGFLQVGRGEQTLVPGKRRIEIVH